MSSIRGFPVPLHLVRVGRGHLLALLILSATVGLAQPTVSNVRASQRTGTRLVDITYDLSHATNLPSNVRVEVSQDGATNYVVPAALTGAVGASVAPGTAKAVVWNVGVDWPLALNNTVRVRVIASDGQLGTVGPPPPGMSLIPAGTFTMGDSFGEGNVDELPTHSVSVSLFYLQKTEVSYAQWIEVYDWNASGNHGYDFPAGQRGSQGDLSARPNTTADRNHPVTQVSFWDVVKWCNAKSQKEGLTPCYYSNPELTTEVKSRTPSAVFPSWSANGYRLPSEAEWEYAARGGLSGMRYPWGDTISGNQATYLSSGAFYKGTSPVGYFNGSQTPPGVDMKNGYGLYDMAGNAQEWCWDFYGAYPAAIQRDPRGPESGTPRVVRGGAWAADVNFCRVAARTKYNPDTRIKSDMSFRYARSSAAGTIYSGDSVPFSLDLRTNTTATAPTITSQPVAQLVQLGATITLTVGVSGTAPFTFQWRKNGAAIIGATNSSILFSNVGLTNAGAYTVLITNDAGSVSSNPATLTVGTAPTISNPPLDQSVALGSNVTFSVTATGIAPLTYQWTKDGRSITGATDSLLALSAVTDNDAGNYSVTVASSGGAVVSRSATLVVSPATSRIVNLSVRSSAGVGNATLIVGFVIAGEGAPKAMLVRGIGPSLTQFGVTGVLADPLLTLSRESIFIQSNDDWGTSPLADQIAATAAAIGAFPLNRTSKDAALRVILQQGQYTASVSSAAGTGIALVEAWDADIAGPARLVNVSARSFVERGAGVLIVGFAVQGNTTRTVLVRGIGPGLALFGVNGVLADPQLVLLKNGSDVVATNDDWWRNGGAQNLAPVFAATGAFALVNGLADAALVATVPPGSYTAQLTGAGDSTGTALIEVFEVP